MKEDEDDKVKEDEDKDDKIKEDEDDKVKEYEDDKVMEDEDDKIQEMKMVNLKCQTIKFIHAQLIFSHSKFIFIYPNSSLFIQNFFAFI